MAVNAHVDKILSRAGPYTDESFQGGETAKGFLTTQCKVLVIGAGGLGCEILTNLALSGFRDIHIIDMDTIDVSNLNRQFLFRHSDVGRSKAQVAADFVMRRCPAVAVTAHHCKIQDKDDDFYMSFNLVICGLDSVAARRWISATLVGLVDEDNPESLKPLIDGGTEGFKGQARVILPTVSSCYECSLDMLGKQTVFPICTIANTPRLPEHCIEWASVLEWPRVHGDDKKLDTDDPEHIAWLLAVASKRADQHGILGVTWSLTQGVVKNIIPAIASTNAVIAAACTQEAFKFATTAAFYLDNYMMYTGNEGVYTYTFEHKKRPDCPVCGGDVRQLDVAPDTTLARVIEMLAEMPDLQLQRPSLSSSGRTLYFQSPKQLEEASRPNLEKALSDLLQDGDEIDVTDERLPFQLSLRVNFV
ncbi:hypothetical protein FA10DRAFT_263413 [Acaromyces ingoldii]|uniref:NEDD8-activating enzyme E1 catalytic subunit n=1 Tax=Acaromyces ingoldii TaxID=215250 RepID=A0A316YXV3_9BASI|nr:hypothetical protein FA10DRAFT_263413 [Acaromyces ingoldii]PWN92645.1 hypothetical protein FA10DRAFT_263413 [Acaromyces ingoldii]